jgi:cytidylate kinase
LANAKAVVHRFAARQRQAFELRNLARSLGVRNYRLYFCGQLVSVVGTWMQTVAQSFLVLHLTNSGTALGLSTAARFLPMFLFGPVGGLAADRMDKRRVLYVTQTLSGLLAGVFAVLIATGTIRMWMVYVLALALGGVNVQPRLRCVHRLLAAADGDVVEGQRRRAVADRDADRPGRRWGAAVCELERDHHRRVPREPARSRARHQQRRRGGSHIGPALAERLGVPFLDRAIPAAVAADLAVPFDDAEAHDEQLNTSWLERLLAGLLGGDAAAPLPVPATARSAADFRAATEQVLRRQAASGRGVILGRGAAIVLRDDPRVLRVRIDGPPERRLEQAMRLEKIDRDTARERQRQLDRAHATYAQHFYGADINDPSLYHVMLDSTTIRLETCVAMLQSAASAMGSGGV